MHNINLEIINIARIALYLNHIVGIAFNYSDGISYRSALDSAIALTLLVCMFAIQSK